MQIKIKRKPINKKKLLRGIYIAALMGLVFGTVSALSFAFLFNGLGKYMSATTPTVIIQQEAEETQEIVPVSKDVNSSRLKRELYSIKSMVEKALVRFDIAKTESYVIAKGESNVKMGIVFSKNSKIIYILSTPDSLRGKVFVDVTFHDGTTVEGRVIETDYISGLSVVRIDTSSINQSLYDSIPDIEFGNSNKIVAGDMVLAIGNINGTAISSIVGNVANVNETFSCLDGELAMIGTDIPSQSTTNGFLFNSSGLLCGIISHGNDSTKADVNMINAIGCSDLTATIYKLSEGIPFPYIGIRTRTINYMTSEIYGIPLGIFVSEVEMDSPAFEAGLRVGDIIVASGDDSLLTGRGLHTLLMGINLDKGSERTIRLRVLRGMDGAYEARIIPVDPEERN